MESISRTYQRCDELVEKLDMKLSGDLYVGKNKINKDFNISLVEIQFDSDYEWSKKIKRLTDELKRRKEKL